MTGKEQHSITRLCLICAF